MNKGKAEIIIDETTDHVRFILAGDLIFNNITGVKIKIEEFLESWTGKKLSIKIHKVSALDLSFLQLLEIIFNDLQKKKAEYVLKWEMDDEMRMLLKQTGFQKYT